MPLGSLSDRPNQITVARLVVTLLCFVCLSLGWLVAGLLLFVLAAATDWADGYWARRWGPITKLGRVLDPLADKLLICGVFVFLAALPDSDIAPWMAVVVLARELIVTALRSFIESGGGDFSAKWLGKQKMVFQVIAASTSLLQAAGLAGMRWPGPWVIWDADAFTVVDFFVWASIVLTILSGLEYCYLAIKAAKFGEQEQGVESES